MLPTDKTAFAALIVKTWRFYGKRPEVEDIAAWFDLLEDCPFATVATAFKRHLTDPNAGQYLPSPPTSSGTCLLQRERMTIPIPTKPGGCWCG